MPPIYKKYSWIARNWPNFHKSTIWNFLSVAIPEIENLGGLNFSISSGFNRRIFGTRLNFSWSGHEALPLLARPFPFCLDTVGSFCCCCCLLSLASAPLRLGWTVSPFSVQTFLHRLHNTCLALSRTPNFLRGGWWLPLGVWRSSFFWKYVWRLLTV